MVTVSARQLSFQGRQFDLKIERRRTFGYADHDRVVSPPLQLRGERERCARIVARVESRQPRQTFEDADWQVLELVSREVQLTEAPEVGEHVLRQALQVVPR